jgi:hypothetical protein
MSGELQRGPPARLGRTYRWMMMFLGLLDGWLHLSCRSFIKLASEGFDRDLSLRERGLQAMHRVLCGLCRLQERRLRQLRALAHELTRAEGDLPPVELSPEAAARIRQALRTATTRPSDASEDPREGPR